MAASDCLQYGIPVTDGATVQPAQEQLTMRPPPRVRMALVHGMLD